MINLKACPKCHGDLSLQKDQYGRYLSCLQCGYLKELPEVSRYEKSRQTAEEVEKLAA